MRTPLKILLAAPLLATLMCGPISAADIADPDHEIVNDQEDLDAAIWGEAIAQTGEAYGAASVGGALGNTASGATDEDVSVQMDNSQRLRGDVGSDANIAVDESGPLTGSATTYGNSYTGQTAGGDLGLDSTQSTGEGYITSGALIEAAGYAEAATATATTGANTASAQSDSGRIAMEADQFNAAHTGAKAQIDAPGVDVPVATATSFTAINNAGAYTAGDADLTATQENTGEGYAVSDIDIGATYAGTSSATMVGNNMDMLNEGGVGTMDAMQTNSGGISATATVDADLLAGQGTANATVMGNSASSATTGGEANITIDQDNSGNLFAGAGVGADKGETAMASSQAYGNSAGATLCNCGGEMNATNRQTNSGGVKARAVATGGGQMGVLTASAIAVGNSATFEVGSPD